MTLQCQEVAELATEAVQTSSNKKEPPKLFKTMDLKRK